MTDPARRRNRVIRAAGAAQWRPPEVGTPETPPAEERAALPTAAELEAIAEEARREGHAEGYEQGRQEGFEYGHREGLEAGRRELLERIGVLDGLIAALDRPFEALDDQVEQELLTLVVAMVKQLVRREIRTDPSHIVGVVREALDILPVNARRIRVLLHPEDAAVVRAAYALGESDQKWRIVEDPVIQRGGCRVLTENSQVDATLESRLNALIAPLLGNERGQVHAADDAAQ